MYTCGHIMMLPMCSLYLYAYAYVLLHYVYASLFVWYFRTLARIHINAVLRCIYRLYCLVLLYVYTYIDVLLHYMYISLFGTDRTRIHI